MNMQKEVEAVAVYQRAQETILEESSEAEVIASYTRADIELHVEQAMDVCMIARSDTRMREYVADSLCSLYGIE